MEYLTLKSLGIVDYSQIERYSVRSEVDKDILKIYFKKKKGELFHHSRKFKFSRTRRAIRSESAETGYREISEVSPMLTKAMAELDDITNHERNEKDVKDQILSDLKHLRQVVDNKIKEIEGKLNKL